MRTDHSIFKDLEHKAIRGVKVPSLGFGTHELTGITCLKAVVHALSVGYRHVDTARAYGNEVDVGQGIRESGVERSDIFLTSKVWPDFLQPDLLADEIRESLELLQTDYLDLALIHWPNPKIPLEQSLDALMNLKLGGKIRQFGVSNFTPALLRQACAHAPVFCIQVEYHPLLGQDAILRIAREQDILVTAYSPLARGLAIKWPEIEQIALKHGKQPEQIVLRWVIEQKQVAAIPRSSNARHIENNFSVFDFELDDDDRSIIRRLPKDQRQVNPSMAPGWQD